MIGVDVALAFFIGMLAGATVNDMNTDSWNEDESLCEVSEFQDLPECEQGKLSNI